MKIMVENQKSDGLNIALPTGSLEENVTRLFEEAYLRIRREARSQLARILSDLFSRVTFMRPQHMPKLVESGAYDLAICGFDCVMESEASVAIVTPLSIGRGTSNGEAKVVLVTDGSHTSAEVPEGSVILSEYPNITRGALGDKVDVRFSYGGTEAHIPSDYRYGVCLTDSGESLAKNKLKVQRVLLQTYTALIANISAWNGEKAETIKTVQCLLLSTLQAREKVLLKMNVSAEKRDAVLAVLPALKTPTVAPLADGKSFAIETVVPREEANDIIIKAAQAGAEGILELPFTKLIPKW